MPLIHGKSQKAFEKNIKTEMEHGKPMKQSLAIAYAVKRKAQHKAKGGFIGSHQSKAIPHYDADFSDMSHDAEEMASGFPPEAGDYAKGGEVKKESPEEAKKKLIAKRLMETFGDMKKHYSEEEEKAHRKYWHLGEFKKDDVNKYAAGGLVDKVMAKKCGHYSMGGVVANDTDMDFAKKEPAEYDYLVKEGGDSFHYTGANSGDELSTAGEVSRKEAMLRKIMASRAKKDKMPYYP